MDANVFLLLFFGIYAGREGAGQNFFDGMIMRIAIIGAGRMGFVQARIARFFGDEILCCVEPQDEARGAFEGEFHRKGYVDVASARAALEDADLIWCTTVDGAIECVGKRLGAYALRGVVLHKSGALSSKFSGKIYPVRAGHSIRF